MFWGCLAEDSDPCLDQLWAYPSYRIGPVPGFRPVLSRDQLGKNPARVKPFDPKLIWKQDLRSIQI